MQEIHTDLQSLGGSGGGFGFGGGYNPLLWLITLGFLRGGGGGFFGGGEAGGTAAVANTTGIAENSAKIDCLQQGQSFITNQLNEQASGARFNSISDQIRNVQETERDIQESMFRTTSAIQQALADCCCRLEKGQASIETALALQTNTLTTNANNNTQRIIDQITTDRVEALKSQNDSLQRQLGIAETVKQITQACGCCGPLATVTAGKAMAA